MMKDDQRNGRIAGTAIMLLCLASGATDANSYLTLGHVFTSAMTGAMALCMVALVRGKYAAASRAGIAIGSYIVGSIVATLMQVRLSRSAPTNRQCDRHPAVLRVLLAAEAVLLAIYVAIAAITPTPHFGAVRYALIAISAVAMGLQAVIARDIHERGITTVVLNTTITSLAIALTRRLHAGDYRLSGHNSLELAAILAYATGAASAALGITFAAFGADLLPLCAVLIALVLYRPE